MPSVHHAHSEIEPVKMLAGCHGERSRLNQVREVGSDTDTTSGNIFNSAAEIPDQRVSGVFRKMSAAAHRVLMHPSRARQRKNVELHSLFQSHRQLHVTYSRRSGAVHAIERWKMADLKLAGKIRVRIRNE